MKKKLDDITKDELEQLYLDNDWDVKKIAEKTGWSERKIRYKFISFYDTEEKIQNLVNKFKIISNNVLRIISSKIAIKTHKMSINFYQIALKEIVESYKINNSFDSIAKKYKTSITGVKRHLAKNLNTAEDFLYLVKEIDFPNYCSLREFLNIRDLKEKLIKLGILHIIFPDYKSYINWNKILNNDQSSIYDIIKEIVDKNNIKKISDLSGSARERFSKLSYEEKELIFPGITSGSGWEKLMEIDLQKEFSDYTIISQKKFNDCRNINQLPFDLAFYSPSDNLIVLIEIQGPTHFTEVYGDFEGVRKRDIIKHDYCKTNNIPLFYFTYEPSLIEEYGYPYYIYTDFDKLVEDIRKLLNNPN